MALPLATLSVDGVRMGEVERLDEGQLRQDYVRNGASLTTLVIGRIVDVLWLTDNFRVLVLGPPLPPSPYLQVMYDRQERALERLARTDDANPRMIWETEPWATRNGSRILVRLTGDTTLTLDDVSGVDMDGFLQDVPVVNWKASVVEIGGTVLCTVEPRRIDTPAEFVCAESRRMVYNREFWLQASSVGRLYRPS